MTIIEAANKYFGYEVKDVQGLFEEMDEEFTYNRRWIEVMQFLKWVERMEKR